METPATTPDSTRSVSDKSNPTLIAAVTCMSALIVVLSIILVCIWYRRKARQMEQFKSSSQMVQVISSSDSPLDNNHQESTFTNDLVEIYHTEDVVVPVQSSHTTIVSQNSQNSPYIDSIEVFSSSQEVLAYGCAVTQNSTDQSGPDDGQRHSDDLDNAPKKTFIGAQTLSPIYENGGFHALDDLLSTAEKESLPVSKLSDRRRSGESSQIIRADKETTLHRVSNLFRSDTKAYQFYIKTIQNYEMPRELLMCKGRIGKGHFGTVYEGVAKNLPASRHRNYKVAVKTLKDSAPDSEKQEFLYEVEIMRLVNSLNHPNIIKFLGCVTRSQPYMIVLELMHNGNLQRFLRDTKSKDVYYNLHGDSDCLTERHLIKFGLDIAKGMSGVADLQLLHRDLATRNILLDEHLTCKVADFGFAKDILNKHEYRSKSVFQRPRPTRWLPPESIFKFKHGIQSDVWSYGIVLWEIVTLGNLPYPGKSTQEVMKAIAKGYRMACPRHCSIDLYRIMAECWEEQPSDRPNFKAIVDKMAELFDKANGISAIERLDDDDYVDNLPPQEQEILLDYAASETLC